MRSRAELDFADPPAGDGYALCLYDEAALRPRVLLRAEAPGGDTCGRASCWRRIRRRGAVAGFAYVDRAGTPDGVTRLTVEAGSDAKGHIVLRGRGVRLRPPLPEPVLLLTQLHAKDGACWEAAYSLRTVVRNDRRRFTAAIHP